MQEEIKEEMTEFFERLGLKEEPLGMFYTDHPPKEGFAPKPGNLPTREMEIKGEINWGSIFENFSCVMGNIWRARRKGTAAYFDRERFGCLGGAFYLGFLKPQLEFIAYYISTGIPNQIQGEHYLESPEITRHFFQIVDPRPAPARYCVFKPISHFTRNEQPELVIFFARSEILCGLNQLATYVTNDFEAVFSPFGAGCTGLVTWPLKFLAEGKLKAVLGGWDPSDRKFLKPDELAFTVPWEMFERMIRRWPDSFLKTPTWEIVRKKIRRSRRIWGEE
ncbi:MAG: hypothetical protein A2Y79_11535 [Deltaproteobacteria bacterium RBG_13_43_22]|nr:MAG: hypothetical protein A2Y79_11535 [Deltaproteobacteria bacterium RBG_13_43_22]